MKHPLVNDQSPLLPLLLLLRKVVEADECELRPVDNYCSKYEEEVDEDHDGDLLENLTLPHLVLAHTSTTNVPVSKDIRPVRIRLQ